MDMLVSRERAEQALSAGHAKAASGCWEWQRARAGNGYGNVRKGFSREMRAHRAAYIVWVDTIPDGLCVLHKCDNRACINPAHLFLGTKADNSRDMVAKGRQKCPARQRTACPRGHPYDGTNSRGARTCSICNRATALRHYYRSKAA